MNLVLQRYSMVTDNGGSTQGLLFEKTDFGLSFICHTLEDEARAIKVEGETRIPSGFYPLKVWNNGQNPNQWVLDHRARYGDWFKFPIEICNVPNFAGVLIHTGTDRSHTEGCLLLDDTMGNNSIDKDNQGSRSLQAVQRFYEKYYPLIERGDKAFIEIRDENFLTK